MEHTVELPFWKLIRRDFEFIGKRSKLSMSEFSRVGRIEQSTDRHVVLHMLARVSK